MMEPKDSSTGVLYLVATPIGNMEDLTLRAMRILSEVDYLACEDTRKTGNLLHQLCHSRFFGLRPQNDKSRFLSYYEQNEQTKIPQIIFLLKDGKSVALVSNAGTPTISDPGFKLVRECIKEGIKIISIPGPSAILTALTSSGLPTDKFLFLGFLPKKQGKRRKLLLNLYQDFRATRHAEFSSASPPKEILKQVQNDRIHPTIIFYESPFRLIDTLTDLQKVLGDLEIVICRELTKIHEEIRREKISQSIEYFSHTSPRGEFTILFNILQE